MPDIHDKVIHKPAENLNEAVQLAMPEQALGIVIIIEGSTRWMSMHMDDITRGLNAAGIGTLQLEMQTAPADVNVQTDAEISALTHRLVMATEWVQSQVHIMQLPLAYFCTGTGTAAAIQAAAAVPQKIKAIVSAGGRPDRADKEDLNRLKSPILLLVGNRDDTTLNMNQEAYSQIHCTKHISTIPGAHHLFEEPMPLQATVTLATEWFTQYMVR